MPEQKVTYQQVFAFANAAQAYLNQLGSARTTRFSYALSKVLARAIKVLRKHDELLEELRTQYCATEKIGEQEVLLKDPAAQPNDPMGGYRFDRNGIKQFQTARVKLAETAVTLDCYHATSVPATLTELQREAFTPFVLPVEDDAEVEARLAMLEGRPPVAHDEPGDEERLPS